MSSEERLHREILAFSISHDHETVRIYGHYAMIDGNKTTPHRHPIHELDFTELDGKEKKMTYIPTKNTHDTRTPTHPEKICPIIDNLPPDLNFKIFEIGESELS